MGDPSQHHTRVLHRRESLLGIARKWCWQMHSFKVCTHSRINMMFCVAGFRPGRRGFA